jgi:hypothetical protein
LKVCRSGLASSAGSSTACGSTVSSDESLIVGLGQCGL